MRIAIVFPGQGTQQSGMGDGWKGHPSWAVLEQLEGALDQKFAGLLLDADAQQLSRTRDAQLAVLLTSLIAWDALRTDLDQHEVVGFAGHSLGQITALIAAGVFDATAGVRFAEIRATATQRAADSHPGKMAALLGANVTVATAACDAASDGAWIANDNAPGQIVIAGTETGVEQAIAAAKALGVRKVMPLAVGGAFHTPLMESAAADIAGALDGISWSHPSMPVVSNGDALAKHDGAPWRDRLILHPTRPVLWRESMLTLHDTLGAEAFLEVGHGSMIAGVAKRTVAHVPVLGVAAPDDLVGIQERIVERVVAARAKHTSISHIHASERDT